MSAAPIATPLFTIAGLWLLPPEWGVLTLCAATLAGVLVEALALAIAVARLRFPTLAPVEWMDRRCHFALPAILSVDGQWRGRVGRRTNRSGGGGDLRIGKRLPAVLRQPPGDRAARGHCDLAGDRRTTDVLSFVAADDWDGLRRIASRYAYWATLASILAGWIFIMSSERIVRVVFQGGAFDDPAVRMVSTILQHSLLQLPFAVLLTLASKLAVSFGASAVLARVSAAGCLVNLGADLILARWIGLPGIALATSITQCFSVMTLFLLLRRREPRLFKAG